MKMKTQISEKDFENWMVVEGNLSAVIGHPSTLLGRQIQMQDGRILDILAMYTPPEEVAPRVVVIELKRDEIDNVALLQVMGYMASMWEIIGAHYLEGRLLTGYAKVGYVEGILSAPSISATTEQLVAMIPTVRYVGLDVEISARPSLTAFDLFRAERDAEKEQAERARTQKLSDGYKWIADAVKESLYANPLIESTPKSF